MALPIVSGPLDDEQLHATLELLEQGVRPRDWVVVLVQPDASEIPSMSHEEAVALVEQHPQRKRRGPRSTPM